MMEELLYRIADCAYQLAHALPDLDDCQRHLLTDICEGESRERTIELIMLYLDELHCCSAEQATARQREYIVRMVLAECLADIDANASLQWLERAQEVRPWPRRRRLPPF